MEIKIKRIYEPPEPSDGLRILVDRLWPRGIAKDKAAVDEWLKEIAPSNELRTWFGHQPERWTEFQRRYRAELRTPEHRARLDRLRAMASKHTVTLLYAAKDEEHNNARALAAILKRG